MANFSLAKLKALSKSFSVHNPMATGFLALKVAISARVPFLMAKMVGLVVPISLQICESAISGQLRIIHKIPAGLSLR